MEARERFVTAAAISPKVMTSVAFPINESSIQRLKVKASSATVDFIGASCGSYVLLLFQPATRRVPHWSRLPVSVTPRRFGEASRRRKLSSSAATLYVGRRHATLLVHKRTAVLPHGGARNL